MIAQVGETHPTFSSHPTRAGIVRAQHACFSIRVHELWIWCATA